MRVDRTERLHKTTDADEVVRSWLTSPPRALVVAADSSGPPDLQLILPIAAILHLMNVAQSDSSLALSLPSRLLLSDVVVHIGQLNLRSCGAAADLHLMDIAQMHGSLDLSLPSRLDLSDVGVGHDGHLNLRHCGVAAILHLTKTSPPDILVLRHRGDLGC